MRPASECLVIPKRSVAVSYYRLITDVLPTGLITPTMALSIQDVGAEQ